ncbi:hypothetical protein C0Q70_04939 [Pomacea canaliculata]|uniref:G-protein coupled receptors family 1 profile domain-containing protein n=1 Tax=Pomacea canaliculata TaxID=400727 RepID=A0A2T7PJS3_POMCA|nr:hypothetical protein C0Q70_04939 [Pomacea canaliculata]
MEVILSTTPGILFPGGNPEMTTLKGGGGAHAGHSENGHVHVEASNDHDMAAMLTMAERMHWGASVVVGPIFVFLGLIGNIFAIIVWNRRGMRSSTGRYLTALAIADSGVLIWFFLVDSLKMFAPEVAQSIFCNEKRANVGIFIILATCFIINLPHFWSYQADFDRPAGSNTSAIVMSEFQKGEGAINYEFWVHCIFLVLLPWFTIFILNLLIIGKISRTNKKMIDKKTAESADKSRRSENQITRLLLIVTFTFLFLIGFQCITQCFFMLMPDGFDKNIISEAFAAAKLGIIVNSSINFLLYCMSGRRFRQEFSS